MDLTGQQLINAPRQKVYEALNDPEILRQSIPGCESLDKRSDTEMDATVAVRIGPVKAKFNGSVELTNLNPPESYTIVGEGKGGPAGFAKGSADVKLSEQDGKTLLDYSVKADIGGKLAQLGGRLIDGTAKKLSGEFFETFGALVEGDAGAGGDADGIETPATDASTKPAATGPSGLKLGIAVAIVIVLAFYWFYARG